MDAQFRELERALAARPDLTVWWRDDDISCIRPWHPVLLLRGWRRLRFVCDLLAKTKIPALLAVEPRNFPEKGSLILNVVGVSGLPVAVHGLRHENRARAGKSEFPPEYAGPDQCREILAVFRRLRQYFGDRLLPVFVPPFNTIASPLREMLEESGITISSSNAGDAVTDCNNTDYDFVDWERRKLLPREKILADLVELTRRGTASFGINSHHKLIAPEDRDFVRGLLGVLDAHARRTGNTSLPFGHRGA